MTRQKTSDAAPTREQRVRRSRRRHDPEITLARSVRRAGIDKGDYIATRSHAMVESAKRYGWRRSELAMALGNIAEVADRVWAKSPTRRRKAAPLPEGSDEA